MKKLLIGLAVAMAAIGLSGTANAAHNNNSPKPTSNYSYFCHRTNSTSNPYTKVPFSSTFDEVNGQGLNDHTLHFGPVVSAKIQADILKALHLNWGDIIPPVSPFLPFGYNWTTRGQSVYNNDCSYPVAVQPVADVQYTVACNDPKTAIVVTLTNTGTASGTVIVNGEQIAVAVGATVTREYPDGTQITITYPNEQTPRYNQQVTCQVGGSGSGSGNSSADNSATMTGTELAAAQLPSTSGTNYAALFGTLSAAAIALSLGSKRLFAHFL